MENKYNPNINDGKSNNLGIMLDNETIRASNLHK